MLRTVSKIYIAENYTKIFRPFLNVSRIPGFKSKAEYKDYPVEPNAEIILTSAHYRSNWVYEKWKGIAMQMFKGNDDYCAVNLDYNLSIHEGLLPPKFIEQVMQEDDFDPIAFSMEYEALFYGSSEKAYFRLEDMQKCRKVLKPAIFFDEATIASSAKRVAKMKIPKVNGEKRIISLDVALSGGKENDNSIFTLIRLLPNGDEYKRQIVNIYSLNGANSDYQALMFKRLFYDFEADWAVLDALGLGMSVYDELIKVTRDNERDTEYEAWKSDNDEALAERAPSMALPVIYTVKANVDINHTIATKLRAAIENGKIELLANDIEGRDYLEDKYELDKIDSDTQARMLAPFFQTTALINEMINLEYEILNGKIRLKEKGRMRKDRYSSLAYGNLLASILEEELKEEDSDFEFGLFFD